jgi:hypothetical protein
LPRELRQRRHLQLLDGLTLLKGGKGPARTLRAGPAARAARQIRLEILVDHGGTPTDPSDDEFLSEELLKGSTGRSDDFCAAAVPA